jgi:putative FmdB family regulatory protein
MMGEERCPRLIHQERKARNGRSEMPIYDYRCKDCGHDFIIIESLGEHEVAKPTCPECKAANVERVIGFVHLQTAKKS